MTIGTGILDLADGRRVAYAGTGPADGPAVLYCHGIPGSRWELGLAEAALQRAGSSLHLIALNRPGYGPSSFRTLSGFVDWTSDVEEVLDRLGVDHLAVLGASGGTPFALACAATLPDRVTRVGVVVGAGPPHVPGMERSAPFTDEPASPIGRRVGYGLMSLAFAVGLGPALARRIIGSLGPEDRRALGDPAMGKVFLTLAGEAFDHWGRGAAQDGRLLRQRWDFDPNAVTRPVRLWYGEWDTQIPVEVGRSLEALVPDSNLVIWPDHGHFSWVVDGDALADIVSFLGHERG